MFVQIYFLLGVVILLSSAWRYVPRPSSKQMRADYNCELSEDAGEGVSDNGDFQTSDDEEKGTRPMPTALLARCKQIGYVEDTSTPLVSERFIRAWEVLRGDLQETSDKEVHSARMTLLSYASRLKCFKIASPKHYVCLRWAVYLEWLIISDAEQEAWLRVLEFDPEVLRRLFYKELKSLYEICGVRAAEFHSTDQIMEAYVEANTRLHPPVLTLAAVGSGSWELRWLSGKTKAFKCHDRCDLSIQITIAAESNRWKINGDGVEVSCFPCVHDMSSRQLQQTRADIPRLGEATDTEILKFADWLGADAERVRRVAIGLQRVRSPHLLKIRGNELLARQVWPDTDDEFQ